MTTPNTLFRKKPVEVEAFQLPAAGVDVPDAFHEWCERVGFSNFESGRDETLLITTPEGVMEAEPGDWIICGVMGDFYPCKPEVFAATYAAATLPSSEADDEPGYVETVIACLGDDAAALRSENSESEVAENMERAADLLAALASPMAVQVAEALTFYAEGNHFIQHEPTAWDTVSGEPQNFFEDEANTATVEDGSIARIALAALAEVAPAQQPVAYFNDSWTLTPLAYAEAIKRDPSLFADMKPAYPRAAPVQQCPNCKGTFSPTALDPEWKGRCECIGPAQAPPIYRDSTPELHVGNSSFEDWFQAHAKACTGDKQLARDAYAAGMGDPLVCAKAPPVQQEADAAPATDGPPLKGLAHFHYRLEAASGYEQEGVYNNITADGFGRVIAALEGARDAGRAAHGTGAT